MDRRDAIKRTALLLGYAVSSSTVVAVMNGCKADPAAAGVDLGDWKPQFLTAEEGQLVAQIGETILPRTDTPGAIDAGVHSFIDILLKNNTPPEEQAFYRQGLKEFDTQCNTAMGKNFLACSPEERKSFLEGMEKAAHEAADQSGDDDAPQMWFAMKEAVLMGYFTSEKGAKEFLIYDPIPGDYQACIPYSEVGGTWAL